MIKALCSFLALLNSTLHGLLFPAVNPPSSRNQNSDNDQDPPPSTTSVTSTGIEIDPDSRTDNTSDGPNGGDPNEFEDLTGIDSDYGESGTGSAGAAAVGGLSIWTAIKGLGVSASAGFLAAVAGLASLL